MTRGFPCEGLRGAPFRASIIVLCAALQFLGFFWPFEEFLLKRLPGRWSPGLPKTLLITFEHAEEGLSPLDLAMALRGLEKLHPRCAVIVGNLRPTEDLPPLLRAMISRITLGNHDGFPIVYGIPPRPSSLFSPISMKHFGRPFSQSGKTVFPAIDGNADAQVHGAGFIPEKRGTSGNTLQLLASVADGTTVGSFWWYALLIPETFPLQGGKGWIFLPNHSVVRINPEGFCPTAPSSGIRAMALEDFLLRIEQMERGNISPSLDSLGRNATVFLGDQNHFGPAGAFSSLLSRVSFSRPAPMIQILVTFLLVIASTLVARWGLFLRIAACAALFLMACCFWFHSARHGKLVPFVPVVATLLLIIPGTEKRTIRVSRSFSDE